MASPLLAKYEKNLSSGSFGKTVMQALLRFEISCGHFQLSLVFTKCPGKGGYVSLKREFEVKFAALHVLKRMLFRLLHAERIP